LEWLRSSRSRAIRQTAGRHSGGDVPEDKDPRVTDQRAGSSANFHKFPFHPKFSGLPGFCNFLRPRGRGHSPGGASGPGVQRARIKGILAGENAAQGHVKPDREWSRVRSSGPPATIPSPTSRIRGIRPSRRGSGLSTTQPLGRCFPLEWSGRHQSSQRSCQDVLSSAAMTEVAVPSGLTLFLAPLKRTCQTTAFVKTAASV